MKKLRALIQQTRLDPVPAEWMTREELARREGVSSETCYALIREALAAGFLEVREFRVRWGKQVRPRPHYRYTSPAKKR